MRQTLLISTFSPTANSMRMRPQPECKHRCLFLLLPLAEVATTTATLKHKSGNCSQLSQVPGSLEVARRPFLSGGRWAAALQGPPPDGCPTGSNSSRLSLGRSELGHLVCQDPESIPVFSQDSSISISLFLVSWQKRDAR